MSIYDPFDPPVNEALSSQYSGGRRRIGGPENDDNAARVTRPRYDVSDKASDIAFQGMDLHENPQTKTVTATFDLPGLSRENVNIDLHDDRLMASGESKHFLEQEESGSLNQDNEINTSMVNGVLTVTFPKTMPEMAPRKIQIT
ncbi:hypothetical protein AX15_007484 [Amanita polypyramis BW_CC]|nr:hypothetical protein AX15_007484 [Amanita polypyramis BW_CC]